MQNYQSLWKTILLVLFSLYINQTWSAYLPNSEQYNNKNQLEVLKKQEYIKNLHNRKVTRGDEDKSQEIGGGSVKPEEYYYNITYHDGSKNKKTHNSAAVDNWRQLPHGSYDKNGDVVTGNAPTYSRILWSDQRSIFNTYQYSDAHGVFKGDSGNKSASDTDNSSYDSDIELEHDKDNYEDNADIDDNEQEHTNDGGSHTLSRKRRGFDEWFIAPYTRWCGRGNIANNTYNELGGATDVDRCCRRHDLCPSFISAFSSRFEYFNFRPYTISHCNCDRRFRTCLKMNNDDPSDTIGQLFFNIMPSHCFVLRTERKCVDRNAEGVCLKETKRKRAEVRSNLKY
ncbi:uncharacterized protein GIIIspla2 [Eurosta solidaginis]|uniref:uncharacterized protein GIIIspla2 n=1 Tax=Eurosta solidaginis TaxID=178769 RepID=UPI003530C3E3